MNNRNFRRKFVNTIYNWLFSILFLGLSYQCTTSDSINLDGENVLNSSLSGIHENAMFPNNRVTLDGQEMGTGEVSSDLLIKEIPIINDFGSDRLLIEKAYLYTSSDPSSNCSSDCWDGVIFKVTNLSTEIVFPEIDIEFLFNGDFGFLQNDVKIFGSMSVDASGEHNRSLSPGEEAFAHASFGLIPKNLEAVSIKTLNINGYKEPLEGQVVLSSYSVKAIDYQFITDSKGNENGALMLTMKNFSPVDLRVEYCRVFLLDATGSPIEYEFLGGISTGQDFIIKANEEYEYIDENNIYKFQGKSSKGLFIVEYTKP